MNTILSFRRAGIFPGLAIICLALVLAIWPPGQTRPASSLGASPAGSAVIASVSISQGLQAVDVFYYLGNRTRMIQAALLGVVLGIFILLRK